MNPIKMILVIWLSVSLILAGCAKKGDTRPEDQAGVGLEEGSAAGPQTGKYGSGGTAGGAYGGGKTYGRGGAGDPALNDPSSPLYKKIVYFDYDSSEVLPEYVPIVNAHASYLASHPDVVVTLEGHCDERGSPEYNIALGEQRAKSVANMMRYQGVTEGQLQLVSFGEEKPAVPGSNESAWAQNRRVEIVYSGN